jgi:hypothetical protein
MVNQEFYSLRIQKVEWVMMTKRNQQTIDQSQVTAATNNVINMEKLAENLAPQSYIKSNGGNLSLNEEFIKNDSEPDVFVECSPYSKAVKPVKIEKD